jgi:hypothetical protein
VKTGWTLDLGLRELKVVAVEDGQLTQHAALQLPEGAYQDGMSTPLLSQFLSASLPPRSPTRKVRIAIPDAGIAMRDFRLPRLARNELTRAVTYEAKRLVPMASEDVYYAWHAARDESGYAVYLVAAHREMIDTLVGAVSAAGLTIDRIDLKALALVRGAQMSDGLLLDWGAGEATIVLAAAGRPRFFRGFVLDAPDSDPAAQFEELAVAVDTLVKFIRNTNPELALGRSTPLYLAGRLAFLPGAEELARQRFDLYPCWPLPPVCWPPGFPWQAHLTALGLLAPALWQGRITPPQGGDVAVAA